MACEVNNKDFNSQCAELWYDSRTLSKHFDDLIFPVGLLLAG